MEIITTAAAATAAKNNNSTSQMANSSYAKSLMASRALQSNGTSNEVNVSQLEKGDVFKGEITNITGRSVTVSIGNGQTLSATLLDNVALNIGNQLYFEVKENTGSQIFIRPLLDEKFSPKNQTIEKSLQSAGLQLNEKNMAVVKELMDAGMPIDRSSIMKVLQQLVNHPNANISTIVSLMRTGIPVNEQNIAQLEQYQNHTSALNTQMDATMSEIGATFEALGADDAFAGDILRFNHLVVDTFTNTAMEEPLPTLSLQEAFVMEESEVLEFYEQDSMPQVDAQGNVVLSANGEPLPQGSVVMDASGMPVLDADGNPQLTEEFLNQLSEQNPELSREELLAGIKDGSVRLTQTVMGNEIQEAFAEQLRGLGMSEESIHDLLDPKRSAQELLKSIQSYVENNNELTDAQLKHFFASKEYNVLIEQVAEQQWKLTPAQVKHPEEVEQFFTRLSEQTSKLATAMGGGFGDSGEQMGRNAQNMNENLQFIKDMNENYAYMQLPLQLSNQDANSELYVYTNKKSLHKDKKDVSVLLHLDMDNLGSTDIHVQLNGTKVNARFYLDDNRSVTTVKSNIEQLQRQISALGLSLDVEVVRRTQKKAEVEDIVEDFMAKDIPSSQQIKRYTFDMRA